MKISLLQINPIVGDIEGNFNKIADGYKKAQKENSRIVITPELSLIGYPPKDIIYKRFFIAKVEEKEAELVELTKNSDTILIFGSINFTDNYFSYNNILVVAENGQKKYTHAKFLLPDYDIFDEKRYYTSGKNIKGKTTDFITVDGCKIGLTVCEDIWNDEKFQPQRYDIDPVKEICAKGIDLLINISASPFYFGKSNERFEVVSNIAQKYGVKVVLVNQVGANDETVFAGRSIVVDNDGSLLFMAKSFEEDLATVDIDALSKIDLPKFSKEEELYNGAVLGLKDYVTKLGFKEVVLGLSGGIDSAIVAKIAVDAFGKDKVMGILMPSEFSSDHSITDAQDLVKNLGIESYTIPIKDIYSSFNTALKPVFKDLPFSVAEENLQARSRGTLLMAISNKFGKMLLTTGNKSEVSVGYCTLYGDMNGAVNPIGDIYKTDIFKICEYVNIKEGKEVIPKNIISKPPSAELRPNQKDSDSLPEYPILDEMLRLYLEEEKEATEIAECGFDETEVRRILRLVDLAEYKRFQAPTIIKLSKKAFGFGRRYPIVQKWTNNR